MNIDYIYTLFMLFIILGLPALACLGAIIALIVTIKKKGKKVILPYILLPLVSVLCMFLLGRVIYEGRPYSKEPIVENVEFIVEERNLKDYPISEEDLNDVFETCIDYFKNSGDYEFCKLINLRYLYMYSPNDIDIVMIDVSYKAGLFSHVKNYGRFFKITRKIDGNQWEFDSINTCP
ncbi:hypothetical protein [Ruminococcus sp.]|uniref:hypothetical protein n=1 Tax=Ruminococcus sp. TaxID=41978 RepID=UPI0025D6B82B|nr:hypothetical protein [Ruminococcus sp.]